MQSHLHWEQAFITSLIILLITKNLSFILSMILLVVFASCEQQNENISEPLEPQATSVDTAMLSFQQQIYKLDEEYGFTHTKTTRFSLGSIF